ncbi:MAG: DUF1801 domain-containing protein [Pirellulales bacterium]|nr:DUF1801 domain-containing protein [Pirellulales bacterium]
MATTTAKKSAAVASKTITPAAYLRELAEPRRGELTTLHRLIRAQAPRLKPIGDKNGIGYGPFHFRYASGREGDTFWLGLSSRKQYISLYVMCVTVEEKYLAETYKPRLPKAKIGKCCVTFRKLVDVDLAVIENLIQDAVRLIDSGVPWDNHLRQQTKPSRRA